MKYDDQYYKDAFLEQQAVLDIIYDQVTVTDRDGVFIRISHSCAENFGVPNDEILGHSCYELEKKHVLDISATTEVIKKQKKINLIQKTKAEKYLMVTGIPLFDANGDLYRVINVSHDVTLQKQLQQQLDETREQLVAIKEQLSKSKSTEIPMIFGSSSAMQKIKKLVKIIAPLSVTVLLNGETGVGKSLFAKYIHLNSGNGDRPFIQVNCGAIPAELIESELFGYVSGAFTGADPHGKEGMLASAKNGTLFLDEISEMPYPLQVKLLHVLQERSYMKIGETEARPFNARIIAASNLDLEEQVNKGLFRKDLYFRLNVFPITIPPLRERVEDIPMLAQFFLCKINEKYNLKKKMSKEALEILKNYNWPGNVRELENTIERVAVLAPENVITIEDVANINSSFKSTVAMSITKDTSLKSALEIVECQILKKTLEEYHTTRKMAEVLGIDQSTVVKKLQKYNLGSRNASEVD